MKNILDNKVKEEIFHRIDTLTPQSSAQWGKMNVNQNLRHLTLSFLIPLGEIDPTPVNPPKIPRWLLKFFLLNAKPPKNRAETFKEMNIVANGINPADFETEKTNLKDIINRFTMANEFVPENKLVGKFSRNEWGKLNYNHLDHHLRQFGA